ncbi:basic proline-rich protein-like [Perognathus longimembris pacificus]|uniref:basic proline-rich protein-like n=1 Tax=Perognathus longimembris pacificus TaxID=214514 RepID=UPI002019E1B9|nr:basic proline-rich protein-like [Perognathus longimembris pacificus]
MEPGSDGPQSEGLRPSRLLRDRTRGAGGGPQPRPPSFKECLPRRRPGHQANFTARRRARSRGAGAGARGGPRGAEAQGGGWERAARAAVPRSPDTWPSPKDKQSSSLPGARRALLLLAGLGGGGTAELPLRSPEEGLRPVRGPGEALQPARTAGGGPAFSLRGPGCAQGWGPAHAQPAFLTGRPGSAKARAQRRPSRRPADSCGSRVRACSRRAWLGAPAGPPKAPTGTRAQDLSASPRRACLRATVDAPETSTGFLCLVPCPPRVWLAPPALPGLRQTQQRHPTSSAPHRNHSLVASCQLGRSLTLMGGGGSVVRVVEHPPVAKSIREGGRESRIQTQANQQGRGPVPVGGSTPAHQAPQNSVIRPPPAARPGALGWQAPRSPSCLGPPRARGQPLLCEPRQGPARGAAETRVPPQEPRAHLASRTKHRGVPRPCACPACSARPARSSPSAPPPSRGAGGGLRRPAAGGSWPLSLRQRGARRGPGGGLAGMGAGACSHTPHPRLRQAPFHLHLPARPTQKPLPPDTGPLPRPHAPLPPPGPPPSSPAWPSLRGPPAPPALAFAPRHQPASTGVEGLCPALWSRGGLGRGGARTLTVGTESRRAGLSHAATPLPAAHSRCPQPAAHCLLSTAHIPLPAVHCPLPTARCPLPAAHSPLPAAQCPAAHCPLPAAQCPPSCCPLPAARRPVP